MEKMRHISTNILVKVCIFIFFSFIVYVSSIVAGNLTITEYTRLSQYEYAPSDIIIFYNKDATGSLLPPTEGCSFSSSYFPLTAHFFLPLSRKRTHTIFSRIWKLPALLNSFYGFVYGSVRNIFQLLFCFYFRSRRKLPWLWELYNLNFIVDARQ